MTALHPRRSARSGTALVPLGVAIVLVGVLTYGIPWAGVYAENPALGEAMKRVVHYGLSFAWYFAFAVPALIAVGSIYRLFVSRGSRGWVVLKLTAYLLLWALGSSALLGSLFVAYMFGEGHRDLELLVPATLGMVGYFLVGLGLLGSVLRGGRSRPL